MGKHERASVETLERAVADVLCGRPNPLSRSHPWRDHAESFAEAIKAHFTFSRAVFKGNRYGQVGDIMLFDNGHPTVFLELKASESVSGMGTLANITQNALTLYGIYDDSTATWSTWRENHDFEKKVISRLDKHPRARLLSDKSAKGRVIRDLAKKGDGAAQEIQRTVVELATKDKLDYLNYLRTRPINGDRLKVLVYCLVHGFHTKRQIDDACANLKLHELGDQYGRLTTYYSNVRSGRIVVTREASSGLRWLFSQASGFELLIDPTRVTCHVIARDASGSTREILKVVLNWKNVFQGIQTPCLNIFRGRDLTPTS